LVEGAVFAEAFVAFGEEVVDDLAGGDGDAAEAFDFESAGDIGEGDGVGPWGACGTGDDEHGEDHIAGAGDIEDLTGAGLEVNALAVGGGEVGAVFVEGEDDGFELELIEEPLGGGLVMIGGSDGEAGSAFGLGAVEFDGGCGEVLAVIGDAGGVDDDGEVVIAGDVDDMFAEVDGEEALVVVFEAEDLGMGDSLGDAIEDESGGGGIDG